MNQRENDRSADEAEYEFREPIPDLANCAHEAQIGFARTGRINAQTPVRGDTERHNADQDVLDHFNRSRHVAGYRSEHFAGCDHGAGGINRSADPSAAQHRMHPHRFDRHRHDDHHDRRKQNRNTDRQGQFFFLGPAGSRSGNRGRNAADRHVSRNSDVQFFGFHLENILAKPISCHQNNRRHHPGNDDTGNADQQHFSHQNRRT